MKRISRSLLAAVASASLLAGCSSTRHGSVWNYKVLRSYSESNHSPLEKELRALGAEGWNVVSSSYVVDPPQAPHHIVILKKRKE